MNVFLAGATGVIGRRLSLMLIADGHAVTGTTRSRAKEAKLRAGGVTPIIVDVFDGSALRDAVVRAKPEIVIHQLTDLAGPLDPGRREEMLARNARLRIEGTANLMQAAVSAGIRRVVAQSVAFLYAPGEGPRRESDPVEASGVAVGARALERAVLEAPGIDGIVLRYGYFYGPDTWSDAPRMQPALHIDAAAHAALLAVTQGSGGIYNIADDDGAVSIEKARRDLGFDPGARRA